MKKRIVHLLFLSILLSFAVNTYASNNSSDEVFVQKRLASRFCGYVKDDFHVYYGGRILDEADANSFQYLGNEYAKDSWKAFYKGRQLEDVSLSSFVNLGGGYAKDAFRVYYKGRVVHDAASSSFRVLRRGYAEDAWHKYYRGREMSCH